MLLITPHESFFKYSISHYSFCRSFNNRLSLFFITHRKTCCCSFHSESAEQSLLCLTQLPVSPLVSSYDNTQTNRKLLSMKCVIFQCVQLKKEDGSTVLLQREWTPYNRALIRSSLSPLIFPRERRRHTPAEFRLNCMILVLYMTKYVSISF